MLQSGKTSHLLVPSNLSMTSKILKWTKVNQLINPPHSEKKYNQSTLPQESHQPSLPQTLTRKNINLKFHLLIIADKIVLSVSMILPKLKLLTSDLKHPNSHKE